MGRHMAEKNRALAGEVGSFVQRWRDMGVSFDITYLKLPDGRGYDRREDTSQMVSVTANRFGAVDDWVAGQRKK